MHIYVTIITIDKEAMIEGAREEREEVNYVMIF